ncbi:hypothetical protein V5O48_017498, partial [Marasmius crinis-equi]
RQSTPLPPLAPIQSSAELAPCQYRRIAGPRRNSPIPQPHTTHTAQTPNRHLVHQNAQGLPQRPTTPPQRCFATPALPPYQDSSDIPPLASKGRSTSGPPTPHHLPSHRQHFVSQHSRALSTVPVYSNRVDSATIQQELRDYERHEVLVEEQQLAWLQQDMEAPERFWLMAHVCDVEGPPSKKCKLNDSPPSSPPQPPRNMKGLPSQARSQSVHPSETIPDGARFTTPISTTAPNLVAKTTANAVVGSLNPCPAPSHPAMASRRPGHPNAIAKPSSVRPTQVSMVS